MESFCPALYSKVDVGPTTHQAVLWNQLWHGMRRGALDIHFCQIATFIKVHVAFLFGLQTLLLIDFSKIYQLNGLESKNKGCMKFYECCDLTKK